MTHANPSFARSPWLRVALAALLVGAVIVWLASQVVH